MPDWQGRWAGGRWYLRGKRRVFVIERRNGAGVRHTLTLDARDEEEAEKQYSLYLFDRDGFAKTHTAPIFQAETSSLVIDTATINELLEDQRTRDCAEDYRYATALYLKSWGEVFGGRPVASVTVPEIESHLRKWKTARKPRIIALKAFCTYFVDPLRGRLEETQNPARHLEVPPTVAAKHTKPRHYEPEEVARAYRASDSQVQRDVMRLSIMTGMHTTEIERFSQGIGWVRPVDKKKGNGIVAVIWVKHKGKQDHPNSVDAVTLAAAERIMERGRIPDKQKRQEYCHRVAGRLSKELGEEVRPVLYGALRHSFITWARSRGGKRVIPEGFGLSLDEIRDAVGHRHTATTRGYDGTEVPPMIVVPGFKLEHPSDP